MRLIIKNRADEVGKWSAEYIISVIKKHQETTDKPFVLGLPTGSTPLATYKELIKAYKEGRISFKNVITFNMDEYVGISEEHPESYHSFMWNNFFNHIDINPEHVNILNGNALDLQEEAESYERKIEVAGGIDLFMGGVGSDGHLAFNEPFSSLASKTRVVGLTYETILANSRFFDNDMSKVPTTALTIGIGTLMASRELLILATGYNKAVAVKKGVEGDINHTWTISSLQLHENGILVIDDMAATELKVSTFRYFKDTEKDNL